MLSLIFPPNPILKMKAESVAIVDDEIRAVVDGMFEILRQNEAVGIGANMVGVLKRIAIVDLNENGVSRPYTFINPEIIWRSEETQEMDEASLCFPGAMARITRSKFIKLKFLNYYGEAQELEAEGFLATVIQHEIDYLDGITLPDYLSPLKRDMFMRKVQKFLKLNPPHAN